MKNNKKLYIGWNEGKKWKMKKYMLVELKGENEEKKNPLVGWKCKTTKWIKKSTRTSLYADYYVFFFKVCKVLPRVWIYKVIVWIQRTYDRMLRQAILSDYGILTSCLIFFHFNVEKNWVLHFIF